MNDVLFAFVYQDIFLCNIKVDLQSSILPSLPETGHAQIQEYKYLSDAHCLNFNMLRRCYKSYTLIHLSAVSTFQILFQPETGKLKTIIW